MDADRDFLFWRGRLQLRLAEWELDPALLLRGLSLQEAEAWLAARGADLTGTERAYIQASITERERQLQQKRRTTRRFRLLGGVAFLFALVVLYFAGRVVYAEALRQAAMRSGDLKPVVGLDVQFERYEVTNRRYKLCVDAGECDPPAPQFSTFSASGTGDLPVTGLDIIQADIFCRWIGRRLPTLEEWNAAATGEDGPWPWGNADPTTEHANLLYEAPPEGSDPFAGDPDEVGARPMGASPGGIEDLIGNVFEWTSSFPAENGDQVWAGWDGQNVPQYVYLAGGSYTSSPTGLLNGLSFPAPSGTRRKDVGLRCVE